MSSGAKSAMPCVNRKWYCLSYRQPIPILFLFILHRIRNIFAWLRLKNFLCVSSLQDVKNLYRGIFFFQIWRFSTALFICTKAEQYILSRGQKLRDFEMKRMIISILFLNFSILFCLDNIWIFSVYFTRWREPCKFLELGRLFDEFFPRLTL